MYLEKPRSFAETFQMPEFLGAGAGSGDGTGND